MTDRPSISERLARARNSSNLHLDVKQSGSRDAEHLIAVGLATMRSNLAVFLMQLHNGSLVDVKSAVRVVAQRVRWLNASAGWRLDGRGIERVALAATLHHVHPACRYCNGHGFAKIAGTPVIGERRCKHCHGTGKHPLPNRDREAIARVISELEQADSFTENETRRLLR